MDFNELDLIGQQEDLQRRKAIVDALITQQSMPGQSLRDLTGTWFGRNLPADAQRQIEAYRADSQAYRQREQQQLGTELNDFTSRMNGAPARAPVSLGLNEQTGQPAPAYGPTLPAQAPNPREAVIRAMTSQLPEMQAMGKAAMSTMGKAPEYTAHVIGNQLVLTDKAGNVKEGGTYNKADWVDENKVINGVDTIGQRNKQTNEWHARGPAGTTVNLDTKGQTEVQKDALAAMKSSREQALAAQDQVQSASNLLQMLDDPQVRTGFGASATNGLAAIGAKLGFNEGDSVAKTQAVAQELAKNTLAAGQQMKGAFSDKDVVFLNQVAAGKVDFTPEMLQRMASLAYAAAHNTLMNTTEQWQGASKIKGIEGAEGVYPYPKLSYNAAITDRPGFRMDGNGRLQYLGVPATPAAGAKTAPGGRRVISVQQFLGE